VWPKTSFLLAAMGAGLSSVAAVWALIHVLDNGPVSYHLAGWAPPVGIEYVVDNVSAFVASVVSGLATIVTIATRRWADREARDRTGTFYSLQMLLLTGLLGMVVTGDLFNLFVFIEISSLAAYALVFMGGRRGMIAAFRYLILGSIGGSFYLLGVGFLYFHTGTLNMAEMRELLAIDSAGRNVIAGAVFIFVGLGLKMGLVPMHLWLPDAYSYAPSSVNSLIAPIMTKVSAYAMIRMFISVFPPGYLTDVVPIGMVLIVLGIAAVLIGSSAAFWQTDFRRLLAYSSIGQLGLIAIGIGLATPLGFAAALLHIMNHALMKGSLFLVASNVRFRTGAMDINGFVGLGRTMPVTMASFVLVSLAMVGVPPLVGLFSKFYLAQAGADAGNWIVLAIVISSGLLTAAYAFRVIERAYLTPFPPSEPPAGPVPTTPSAPATSTATATATVATPAVTQNTVHEAPADMLVPVVLLAIGTLVLGLLNGIILTEVLETGVLAALER
jgi:multicomponent Na+:H+ antiporter subunit D